MKVDSLNKAKYKLIIVSILLWLISPILSAPIILYFALKSNNKVEQFFLILLFAGTFGYLAYHMIPNESDDLFRHYKVLNNLTVVPSKDIFKYGYPGVWLNTVLMYISVMLNDMRLYPFFMVGIGFLIIMVVLIKEYNRKHIPNKYIYLIFIFVFFMMVPRYYFSGLRNHFVFIIAFYIFYKYFTVQKQEKYHIYISCLSLLCLYFIHNGIFMILFIFLFYVLVYNKLSVKLKKVIHLLILFSMIIISLFAKMIEIFFPNLLSFTLINKVYIYSHSFFNLQNLNLWILFIMILMFCLYLSKELYKTENTRFIKYNDFYNYFLLFCIACIPNMLLLLRFIYILAFLTIVMLFQYFSEIEKAPLNKVLSSMIIILIIQIIYNYISIKSYPLLFDENNLDLIFFFF